MICIQYHRNTLPDFCDVFPEHPVYRSDHLQVRFFKQLLSAAQNGYCIGTGSINSRNRNSLKFVQVLIVKIEMVIKLLSFS